MHSFKLPKSFGALEMLAMARKGIFDPAGIKVPMQLDLTELQFAGSNAFACLNALLIQSQGQSNSGAGVKITHASQDAIHYLARMDFFSSKISWLPPFHPPDFKRHKADARFVCIKQIHKPNETDSVAREIVGCLGIENSQVLATMQYAVSELIDNALQHSESLDGAFVTAQVYEKWNFVDFAIIDTGITIRRHLRKHPNHRDVVDDLSAIKRALAPNVTGTYFSPEEERRLEYSNQGLGLTVTNELAKQAGGSLYLWSGAALHRSQTGAEVMPVQWPGTAVFLRLPRKIDVNHREVIESITKANNLHKPKKVLHFKK